MRDHGYSLRFPLRGSCGLCDVAFIPVQTAPLNDLLSGNNLSLIPPLQKLGQGEKCNIITKAKLPFHAIQYPSKNP